jgi:hypothetical protein
VTRATALGWRAHAALTASGGAARVVAALSGSVYAEAAGDLIWIGPPGAPLHGRALLAHDRPAPREGELVRAVIDGVMPWRPCPPGASLDRLRDGARALHARLGSLGEPRGLGRLLVGDAGGDPVLTRALPHMQALAAAGAAGDPAAAAQAARSLLGLGAGLTPSGDDYVGGVLFAWRLRDVGAPGRKEAVTDIVAAAASLTHPISARLLADLAAGEGWAPLHDLVATLAAVDVGAALGAARGVTGLGHTSGWDLLAGALTGLAGPGALAT